MHVRVHGRPHTDKVNVLYAFVCVNSMYATALIRLYVSTSSVQQPRTLNPSY